MKSLASMLLQLYALLDTDEFSSWEESFISSAWNSSEGGANTPKLSAKQVEKLQDIYARFFGD